MIYHLLLSRTHFVSVSFFLLVAESLATDTMTSLCSKWISDNSSESNIDSSVVSWERNDCSLIDGAMLCVRDPSCRSFFHHASLEKCLGSQSYKRGLPSSHAMQKGWEYFTQSLHCDEGYIYNQSLGLCYKYHAEYRNYDEAMAVCETESAKLLIIKNEAELQHFSNSIATGRFWIGLRGISSYTVWKWWNGQAPSNILWYPEYPRSDLGYCALFCGHSWSCSGHYANYNCQAGFAFVCQRYI